MKIGSEDAHKIGVTRVLPVRDIPVRSPSVAIAGKARSHGRSSYQIGAHDPVAGGQDSTAVAVLTTVAMLMASERVTLISAADTKRGPVVYDDPGDANRAAAGAPQRLAPCVGPAFGEQSSDSGHGATRCSGYGRFRPSRTPSRGRGLRVRCWRRILFLNTFSG